MGKIRPGATVLLKVTEPGSETWTHTHLWLKMASVFLNSFALLVFRQTVCCVLQTGAGENPVIMLKSNL